MLASSRSVNSFGDLGNVGDFFLLGWFKLLIVDHARLAAEKESSAHHGTWLM